jgi:DNA-directed RNA polymerase subunit M/transcription elongation factor TFIIS
MMVDDNIPQCPECQSTEVVSHQHDIAAAGGKPRTSIVSFECVECGRQWQPIAELTGLTVQRIRRYS